MSNNKWKNAAIPALLIHVSIGSVYCWSLFKQEIAEKIGMSTFSVGWCFSLAIFFLGMSAAFAGKLVERDIHASSRIACIMFCTGFIGTGLIINNMKGLPALIGIYISYGVIMGIGLGIGYITPVKTLMLWFSENKGLATGISIAGFGLAKSIASPIMSVLINRYGITTMFMSLGLVYMLMMKTASFLLQKPDSWVEEDNHESKAIYILSDSEFMLVWLIFYLNVHCGLMIISYEKQIITSVIDGSWFLPYAIMIIPSISALFNAGGRIGYSTLSDVCSNAGNTRAIVYHVIFSLSLLASFAAIKTLGHYGAIALFIVTLYLMVVNAGYGGGFSTLPALLSERFGLKNISQIHGLALSAWGIAGITGNNLTEIILNNTHSYQKVVSVTMVLYGVAAIACYFLCKNNRTKQKEIVWQFKNGSYIRMVE